MYEGPVTDDDPVAPHDRRQSYLVRVTHDSDQIEHIYEGGERVGQEQEDEPVQTVARDEAAESASKPDAGIAGNARDRRDAMAEVRRCEHSKQGRLARVQRAVSNARQRSRR